MGFRNAARQVEAKAESFRPAIRSKARKEGGQDVRGNAWSKVADGQASPRAIHTRFCGKLDDDGDVVKRQSEFSPNVN